MASVGARRQFTAAEDAHQDARGGEVVWCGGRWQLGCMMAERDVDGK
jgi:hypothetical protein